MVTFPGEPICELGLAVKDALRKAGIAHPCVAALTTDEIGYILTKAEYQKSGYEVTASFYGDSWERCSWSMPRGLGLRWLLSETGLQNVVMVEDEGGEEEQHQVVNAEGDFVPNRPGAGD